MGAEKHSILINFLSRISPLAPVFAISGFSLIGSVAIFLAGTSSAKLGNPDERVFPNFLVGSSIAWGVFTAMAGINTSEWLQLCLVIAILISSSRLSLLDVMSSYNVPGFLIAANFAQILTLSLLDGWTTDKLIIIIFLIRYAAALELNKFGVATYWGVFLGLRICKVALSGGVFGSPEIAYDQSYDTWIMISSAPVFGIAIFESLKYYFNHAK